ncbi:S8 family peptidase [Selenomonas artemidis]|uniref:Peptidase S8/S53 domain-containing protein n=1 Tax=Selenomonas artemidis F0399 TaxID=749551 RepID=E7N3B6_9FIRM|nr:S8 family peptidase [Selenomonas artemidis]EFW29335.1 hypothetical protein HMPREF9555_01491 [Selenomonas artemidis F0399]
MADHIEISKEDISQWEYKFRPFPGAPAPPIRNVRTHGQFLGRHLSDVIREVADVRTNMGVESDHLLVFELAGEGVEPDIEQLLKLKLSVVEEISNADGSSKIVVQFENRSDIDTFEYERELYENNSMERGVLTSTQRKELFSCIEGIRKVSPEDRTGKRLSVAIAQDGLPDGMFFVDIDVWHNGNSTNKFVAEKVVKSALGTGESRLIGDFFALPNLLLGRAKVNRYTLEALRKLDLIAMVDLPIGVVVDEQCELYAADFTPSLNDKLDDQAPLACVIDSGVFSGNPLLSSVIMGEEDFDLTENTPSDTSGHGTGVAGIIVYGDFHNYDRKNRIFVPLVRICNGKVMHCDASCDQTAYRSDKRPEQIVSETIRYFYKEYHCRIFNLSSGDIERVYSGGRQMPWAAVLDEIARELDVVIVISAGNVACPEIPIFTDREDLMAKCRDQLLSGNHQLIDPATSALGVTVGAITRYAEPEVFPYRPTPISVGNEDYPSVFTRVGEGVGGAVKPEFVDYGGNLALTQLYTNFPQWWSNRALNEPTLNNTIDRVFKGWQGTSFAAPHVTHIAARIERALQIQMSEAPSANLIRAMLASSAKYRAYQWLTSATPPNHTGNNQHQRWRLQLSGYGKVDDSTLFTDRNHVTLFAEDALELRKIHIYKIPVPREFLSLKTTKRIAIGFAYNPPTYLNRKAYIANRLWFEVFRRIDVETLLRQKGKGGTNRENNTEKIIEDFGKHHGAPFFPGFTEIQNSTLQQRVWEKNSRGGGDLLWEDNDPYIYILVTGKEKFKHPYVSVAQPYALSITFSYENEEDIQLREKLIEQVTIKQQQRIRTRAQI